MHTYPTFIFLRHGEAQHNVAQRQYGDSAYEDPRWKDAHLSPHGHQQTILAGEEIARRFGSEFRAIWSSPLSRCIQTAQNVHQNIRTPARILHDSLLERLGGGHVCNERMSKVDIVIQYPGWQSQFLPKEGPQMGSVREPHESVKMRMKSLLLYLTDLYKNETRPILIVTHHDAIEDLFDVSLRNAEFYVHQP
jgi:broad specificity phosphatase PhoE